MVAKATSTLAVIAKNRSIGMNALGRWENCTEKDQCRCCWPRRKPL